MEAYLDPHIFVKENIESLDVSVDDVIFVEVFDCLAEFSSNDPNLHLWNILLSFLILGYELRRG